jgi:hypothetical protein
LFALSDLDHVGTTHRRVVTAGIATRHEAVLHVDAGVGPHRNTPGDAEVDVVGVRNDNEDALDGIIGEQGHGAMLTVVGSVAARCCP